MSETSVRRSFMVALLSVLAGAALACPVTAPNGATPPGERPSPAHHGADGLWTVLPPGGVLLLEPDADGSLATKSPWWRGVTGPLELTGRRLEPPVTDDPSAVFEASVPDGYGDSGFQATGWRFGGEGCWEVVGRVGASELRVIVLVRRL